MGYGVWGIDTPKKFAQSYKIAGLLVIIFSAINFFLFVVFPDFMKFKIFEIPVFVWLIFLLPAALWLIVYIKVFRQQ